MKLYLARHGDYLTHDPQHRGFLSEKGKKDITHIANFLSLANIPVNTIIHSGKMRAQQTAEIYANIWAPTVKPTAQAGLTPVDDIDSFANHIVHFDEDVLVVGHLPFMNKLVSQLICHSQDKTIVEFTMGMITCLEKIDSSQWIIRWILDPVFFERTHEKN